ncbi:MAG: PLP-dependent transferase, partial [Chloroflexi bacterium]|nr:PLP-dependent transferase [Chloroflexota bacterium]
VAILAAEETYGATKTLLNTMAANAGLIARFVRVGDLDAVEAGLAESRPAAFVFEILSNPLVRVADAPALIALAKRYGAKTIVDSTFTTPYLVKPLALGADFVAHSATKYIGGHGDVLAGVVISSAENCAVLRKHRTLVGSNLSPFDAWLCLRGLRTLPLRMRQQCENALTLAGWLSDHPRVERVYYSGLDIDPDHGLAARLLRPGAFGAMLSFDIQLAGRAEAFAVMERLQLVERVPTLGDVTTLVSYPPHSSHRSLTPEARAALGIGDGCIRVSVGIEDVNDLIADFAQALR